MTSHPITPPPELVKQWCHDRNKWKDFENILSIRAARWGADQELDACCEHLKRIWSPSGTIDSLRAALAEQPVVPTDEELCETYRTAYYAEKNRQGPHCMAAGLRAVLARWGQS